MFSVKASNAVVKRSSNAKRNLISELRFAGHIYGKKRLLRKLSFQFFILTLILIFFPFHKVFFTGGYSNVRGSTA